MNTTALERKEIEDVAKDWPELQQAFDNPTTKGIVIYECQDLCSSSMGQRKAIRYGLNKDLSCSTWQEVVERYPRLDCELASTQKHPIFYVEHTH